ncbi:MAG: AAA family ATPase, partial [Planctomycetales bacterium]|nr:AAA family ATPase [Planctomycetales bacterium]
KFISLCDAQRKIEGVYKGRTRTYDLRGRKVCVVMAGNPYTESGERFQIPDMLANRADVYNLGEIIGDNADVFELSYLENCLTSNPTLAPLATRHASDVHQIVRLAADPNAQVEFEGSYSADELEQYTATMRNLLRVRDVVLKVNRQYIRSAAQSDDYRTEPRFQLQGSYRNINRIAERVSPIMNPQELETAIYSSYENDAQTLTSGAESNLLKFKELAATLTPEEATRWEEIKKTFRQNLKMRGIDPGDKFGQVIAQMGVFSDGLDAIRDAVVHGVAQLAADDQAEEEAALEGRLTAFRADLDALQQSLTGGLAELQRLHEAKAAIPAEMKATFSPEAIETLAHWAEQLRGATAAGQGSDHKIEITNRIPRTILAVIREQFKLMQSWLVPLMESSQSQDKQLTALRKQLNTALSKYKDVLGELDDEA